MRILLATHLFPPSVGGIETMSELLAEEFTELGHEVRVITPTPAKEPDRYPFAVHRRPGRRQLWRDYEWCDVFFHNNISLHFAWPLAIRFKPWVVSHQTWIRRGNGTMDWRDRVKLALLPAARSISISTAVARSLPFPSLVVPNCYGETTFFPDARTPRERDIVFVGRLVSDKGVDVLIDALGELRRRGLTPTATIIGDGPERGRLETRAIVDHVAGQVQFAGVLRGTSLADALRRHRIHVTPSRWAEPFGIVALEGIACGCIAVGSQDGGLADAIGPCGLVFPNGDALALADRLESLLRDPDAETRFGPRREAHLARHRRATVAQQYVSVFANALGSTS